MKLIIGLGNPGLRYRSTRHNIGFIIVTHLAKKYGIRIRKKAFKALIGEGRVEGEEALLVLPQTFMNLSGESVASARSKAGGLSDMLVVYDDVDLGLGNIRFREKGSSGGHKGMASIIDKLKTDNFPRLRVGITSLERKADTSDFVLSPFLKNEKPILDEAIKVSVEGIGVWVTSGIEECMGRYNKRQKAF